MGRRKGSLNKSTIAKIQAGLLPPRPYVSVGMGVAPVLPTVVKEDTRSNTEVLNDTVERFGMLARMVEAAATGEFPSVIAAGSPGIGKTTTVQSILENTPDVRFKFISGTLSAIELYCAGLEYCNEGDILIIDDADRVLDSQDAINILKAMTGSGQKRWVSWLTDHARFKGDDGLPKQYLFEGSVIILTNKNVDDIIRSGMKNAEHMEALVSRSVYIDLKLHTRREVMVWVRHLVETQKILRKKGLSEIEQTEALDWLEENKDKVRDLSIRTAEKLALFRKMFRDEWKKMAHIALVEGR